MLKEIFTSLVMQYDCNAALAETLWLEIYQHYSKKKRYYHNLSHLQALYEQLNAKRRSIEDWNSILFSLFYHDIIYKVSSKTNEIQSAELALKRLQSIGYPEKNARHCYDLIIATATHQKSNDADTNLFTDADLSILGQEREIYKAYCDNIRKEYSIYPDFIYKPGRKKVVVHFLEMSRIFKTEYFYDRFELQARQNLAWELGSIST
ncbi:MAG TPA: hypothetical protein VF476_11895 [Chitinophagaceae bacterium]